MPRKTLEWKADDSTVPPALVAKEGAPKEGAPFLAAFARSGVSRLQRTNALVASIPCRKLRRETFSTAIFSITGFSRSIMRSPSPPLESPSGCAGGAAGGSVARHCRVGGRVGRLGL